MYRSLRLVITAALALILLAMMAGSGSAHRLGGKWPSPYYNYSKNLGTYTGMATPIDNAAGAWNSATIFTLSTAPAQSAQVTITTGAYGATDWIGMGVPGPNPYSGTYTYGSVTINMSWTNTRHFNCSTPGSSKCKYPADTASQKRCVAVHEMGHVMGLAHTGESPGYRSIMNPDHGKRCHTWALISPTSHDADDLNAIY